MHPTHTSKTNKTRKSRGRPSVKVLPLNFSLYGAKEHTGKEILKYTRKNSEKQKTKTKTKCIRENVSWFGNYERAMYEYTQNLNSNTHLNTWKITTPTSLVVVNERNRGFFEQLFSVTSHKLTSCISTHIPHDASSHPYWKMNNTERCLYEFQFIYGYLSLKEQYEFLLLLKSLLDKKYLKLDKKKSFILENIGKVIRYYEADTAITNKHNNSKYEYASRRKMNHLPVYAFEPTILVNICKLFDEQGYSNMAGLYVPRQTSFWILFSNAVNNVEEYILFRPYQVLKV
jgi:hypothetical protein